MTQRLTTFDRRHILQGGASVAAVSVVPDFGAVAPALAQRAAAFNPFSAAINTGPSSVPVPAVAGAATALQHPMSSRPRRVGM